MHPNQAFRKSTPEQNITFARQRSFGTLAVNHKDSPLLSHIPFLISKNGKELEFHLVRSNPIVKLADKPLKAVIAITGPDGYVSPDWYKIDDQVPTWNYVAVHLRGQIQQLDGDELPGILERLSSEMEQRLAPKPEWKINKVEETALKKMMAMIIPFKMQISDIQGTWKLSQNKPDDARLGAADAITAGPIGNEIATLARLMQNAR